LSPLAGVEGAILSPELGGAGVRWFASAPADSFTYSQHQKLLHLLPT
jgi:hypothetical protein